MTANLARPCPADQADGGRERLKVIDRGTARNEDQIGRLGRGHGRVGRARRRVDDERRAKFSAPWPVRSTAARAGSR